MSFPTASKWLTLHTSTFICSILVRLTAVGLERERHVWENKHARERNLSPIYVPSSFRENSGSRARRPRVGPNHSRPLLVSRRRHQFLNLVVHSTPFAFRKSIIPSICGIFLYFCTYIIDYALKFKLELRVENEAKWFCYASTYT